ncbi:MAG TPA: hypothetical protein VF472_13715 [Burkholderiaceae bacterium]
MEKKNIFNRMKIASIASGSLLLSACASDGHMTSTSDTVANSNWKGHPVIEAMAKWGKPMRVTPAGNGATLYEWMWSPKYTYDQAVGSQREYKGEESIRNSDGSISYIPVYGNTSIYEQRTGFGECNLAITANFDGFITNLDIKQAASGCADVFGGANSASPDAATAAKAKVLSENLKKAKAVDGKYRMLCAKADYIELFEDPSCDSVTFKVAKNVNVSKLTPDQKRLFSQWRAEMQSITDEYKAFLHSTGSAADKGNADFLDSMKPVDEKYNVGLQNEGLVYMKAHRLATYTRMTYLQPYLQYK